MDTLFYLQMSIVPAPIMELHAGSSWTSKTTTSSSSRLFTKPWSGSVAAFVPMMDKKLHVFTKLCAFIRPFLIPGSLVLCSHNLIHLPTPQEEEEHKLLLPATVALDNADTIQILVFDDSQVTRYAHMRVCQVLAQFGYKISDDTCWLSDRLPAVRFEFIEKTLEDIVVVLTSLQQHIKSGSGAAKAFALIPTPEQHTKNNNSWQSFCHTICAASGAGMLDGGMHIHSCRAG